MYSYIHRYHAGAYADVHKHLALVALVEQLRKKETPFCVLDTHAGEGLYDIHDAKSQKTAEFKKGFRQLIDLENAPALVQGYLDIIQEYNPGPSKHIYPGSPAIIAHLLRPQDKAICIEGHPQASAQLQQNFKRNQAIHIHDRDSLEGMQALVPFKEKRGLIFIDPSYEVKTEYQQIPKALLMSYTRFPQGIYAIWYPLLPAKSHQEMLTAIQRSSLTKVWYCEWIPYPQPQEEGVGLMGSGLVIVNTPWQFDKTMKETFLWLNKHVYQKGQFRQGWI
jgi:23S rRNA (adenine2030-N6)-methyltransferase